MIDLWETDMRSYTPIYTSQYSGAHIFELTSHTLKTIGNSLFILTKNKYMDIFFCLKTHIFAKRNTKYQDFDLLLILFKKLASQC